MSGDRDGHAHSFEYVEPGAESAEALFASLRAKLSDRDRKIVERLDILENVYVRCGRDKVLDQSFETFLRKYTIKKNGRRKHADVFFLTGQSGAGKTEAAERMLRESYLLQPEQKSYGTVRPYVSISLTGYILPRIAAEMIMTAAGHPGGKIGQGDAWRHLSDLLMRRGVCLVHIDETQHLIKKGSKKQDNLELANAIKGVSISPTWPVAFVLSGLPRIIDLPIDDDQVERRQRWVHFPDLDMDKERRLVVRILRELTEAVGMGIGSMPDTDMPERMAHAARHRYARVCEGVVAAIHQALIIDPGATELTRKHFALAFADQSRAPGVNLYNPFVVDDWASLSKGSFLGRDGDDEG